MFVSYVLKRCWVLEVINNSLYVCRKIVSIFQSLIDLNRKSCDIKEISLPAESHEIPSQKGIFLLHLSSVDIL